MIQNTKWTKCRDPEWGGTVSYRAVCRVDKFTSTGEVRAVLQQMNSADEDCGELQVKHTMPASRVAQQQREQPDRP